MSKMVSTIVISNSETQVPERIKYCSNAYALPPSNPCLASQL